MYEKIFRFLGVVLLGAIAFGGILVLVVMISTSEKLWSEKAAGWAQAFGAVAAILGAIGIAKNQSDRESEKRAQDQLDEKRKQETRQLNNELVLTTRLQAINIELEIAMASAMSHYENYQVGVVFSFDRFLFEDILKRLADIENLETSTSRIDHTVKMRSTLASMHRFFSSREGRMHIKEPIVNEYSKDWKIVIDAVRAMLATESELLGIRIEQMER